MEEELHYNINKVEGILKLNWNEVGLLVEKKKYIIFSIFRVRLRLG